MGEPMTLTAAFEFYSWCVGAGWSTLFVYWVVVSIVNITYR